MGYVKWVANKHRHEDWTTELRLEGDKVVQMGVPVNLTADEQKQLEAEGRIFEDSSAEEAKELQPESGPVVGADTAISGPVFSTESPKKGDNKSNDKK